jgi:hypothetical protein
MTIEWDGGTKIVVTVVNAPVGEVMIYFWSTDMWGASTESDAFEATFTFEEVIEPQKLIVETYPILFGAGVTDTTVQLFDASGFLILDENSPFVPDLHNPSAMVVYFPAGGLTSGTVFFASIYSASGNPGPYSVRAYSLGESAVLPDELPEYDYSDTAFNADDSPYEGLEAGLDSDPWNNTYGPGEGPAEIPFGSDTGDRLHRSLSSAHDVDWIKIVIP